MRISLKFLDNAFTVIVLFLGTSAFVSLLMDNSNPNVVTDGSWLTQFGWSLIYIIVLVRASSIRREILRAVKANKALIFLVLFAVLSAGWSADAGVTIRRSLAVAATTLFGIDFAVRYPVREQVRLFGIALGIAVAISVLVELFFHGLVQPRYRLRRCMERRLRTEERLRQDYCAGGHPDLDACKKFGGCNGRRCRFSRPDFASAIREQL